MKSIYGMTKAELAQHLAEQDALIAESIPVEAAYAERVYQETGRNYLDHGADAWAAMVAQAKANRIEQQ